MHGLLVSALVLLPLLGSSCGGSEAPPAPEGAQGQGGQGPTGTIQFVWLARLQGYGEGVPCNRAWTPPLPGAAAVARQLEAAGDRVVLACIGETLLQAETLSLSRPSMVGAAARIDVQLQAMAEAGVDIYVPGHGDFVDGLLPLLDKAAAHGVPVLLSNVTVADRDDVLPYVVVEHNGLRVAVLGLIARQPGGDEPARVDEPTVSFLNPVRRAKELSREIMAKGEADAVLCLSNLTQDTNQSLCDVPDVHFVLTGLETGSLPKESIRRGNAVMLMERTAGRSVGQTTLRVVDGDWSLDDLSARHELPAQLEREHAALDSYIAMFGTDDPQTLAPLVIPENPDNFLTKLELMEENAAFIEEATHWPDSFLDHQHVTLPDVPEDDPVRRLLDQQGPAIRAALARLKAPLEELPDEMTIPLPGTCKDCHAEQYDFWAATGHSRAFQVLEPLEREQDSSCLVCHAVGFRQRGGFKDPRLQAPYGGITCFNCHDVQRPHVESRRLVVDPLYVKADRTDIQCQLCHGPERSPGFDLEAALDAVSCPPMRPDDPALAAARRGALEVIAELRAQGEATPWDDLLEGRALVGLGDVQEGLHHILSYATQLTGWPEMTYSLSRYVDERGDSYGALEIVRKSLEREPLDLQMNIAYVRLLLQARDPAARNPALALSHARLVAPPDVEKPESALLELYITQVDLLMAGGQRDQALDLLRKLMSNFEGNPDIADCLDRNGLR